MATQRRSAELAQRIQGCLIGGALGDSLGGRYEGKSPPVDVRWGPPCQLSDDTQLTMATCEAIIERGKPEPEAIAAAMARWHRAGRVTGLGAATLGALDALVRGGHWALVGRRGEMAAGNGAASRIAPLAPFVDPEEMVDRTLIRDVARITHHSDEAYAGALAVVVAIRAALFGRWSGGPGLLGLVRESLFDSLVRDRIDELADTADLTIVDAALRYGASAYVVESVPLALFAAQHSVELGLDCVLEELVAAGGDTDTNAAIAGQVIGAAVGLAGLPSHHVQYVPEAEVIMELGRRLAERADSASTLS